MMDSIIQDPELEFLGKKLGIMFKRKVMERGSKIILQGKRAKTVSIILKGRVVLKKHSRLKRKNTMQLPIKTDKDVFKTEPFLVLQQGHLIGEEFIFDDFFSKYEAVCESAFVTIYDIEVAALKHVCQKDKLIKKIFSTHIEHKLELLNKRFSNLKFRKQYELEQLQNFGQRRKQSQQRRYREERKGKEEPKNLILKQYSQENIIDKSAKATTRFFSDYIKVNEIQKLKDRRRMELTVLPPAMLMRQKEERQKNMKKRRDSFIDVDQVYDPYQKIIKMAFPSLNSQTNIKDIKKEENSYAKTVNIGRIQAQDTRSDIKMMSLQPQEINNEVKIAESQNFGNLKKNKIENFSFCENLRQTNEVYKSIQYQKHGSFSHRQHNRRYKKKKLKTYKNEFSAPKIEFFSPKDLILSTNLSPKGMPIEASASNQVLSPKPYSSKMFDFPKPKQLFNSKLGKLAYKFDLGPDYNCEPSKAITARSTKMKRALTGRKHHFKYSSSFRLKTE